MKNREKVLITGGAGYIGSILTQDLLEKGYAVTVLDNFQHRVNSLAHVCIHPYFQVIRGDCRDENILKNLLKDSDYIFPLAAIVGAPACKQDPLAATSINRDAVRSLLKLASSQQRVIFPVTNSGYGIGEKGKFCDESTPLRPISLYGINKIEAEQAVMEHGNAVCFRLATVFGMSHRMRIDLLVNDFTYRAVRDRALVIFEGHFKRNYIHVRDVSQTFLYGMENFERMKNQIYNLGLSEANLSKIELARRIQKYLPVFHFIEAEVGEDPDKRDYYVSNQKLEATGWVPQYSLDQGIQELIKGYQMIRNERYANV